jgi:hypothetical protein
MHHADASITSPTELSAFIHQAFAIECSHLQRPQPSLAFLFEVLIARPNVSKICFPSIRMPPSSVRYSWSSLDAAQYSATSIDSSKLT